VHCRGVAEKEKGTSRRMVVERNEMQNVKGKKKDEFIVHDQTGK